MRQPGFEKPSSGLFVTDASADKQLSDNGGNTSAAFEIGDFV